MKLNPPQHNTERSTPHKRPGGVYALQTEAGIKRPCLFTYNPLCSSLDSHHFLIQLQRQAVDKAESSRNTWRGISLHPTDSRYRVVGGFVGVMKVCDGKVVPRCVWELDFGCFKSISKASRITVIKSLSDSWRVAWSLFQAPGVWSSFQGLITCCMGSDLFYISCLYWKNREKSSSWALTATITEQTVTWNIWIQRIMVMLEFFFTHMFVGVDLRFGLLVDSLCKPSQDVDRWQNVPQTLAAMWA